MSITYYILLLIPSLWLLLLGMPTGCIAQSSPMFVYGLQMVWIGILFWIYGSYMDQVINDDHI